MMTKNQTILTLSLLAAMLFVATAGTAMYLQQALAAKPKPPAHPYYPQAAYDRFKKYTEQLLWHYDYSKSERQNQKDFGKWYCSGTQGSDPKICAEVTKNGKSEPQAVIDLMRYFAVYGESYAWDIAVFNTENKHLDGYGLKYMIANDMPQNTGRYPLVTEAAWKVFLVYDSKAFHYNFKKSEQQNLRDYGRYSGKTGEIASRWMWYNESKRDAMLYNQALLYVTGQSSGLPLSPKSPDAITSAEISIWLSFAGKHLDYLWKV
jgi:hypothetical protein